MVNGELVQGYKFQVTRPKLRTQNLGHETPSRESANAKNGRKLQAASKKRHKGIKLKANTLLLSAFSFGFRL
jgi:hypothetical protein